MRARPLVILLLAVGMFAWSAPALAAALDSQLDDSAQATRPPANYTWFGPVRTTGSNYLAVGYIPKDNLSITGVRFRVNASDAGNYVCPIGAILRYNGTSLPVTWDSGLTVGNIVPVATTTPDANGNCDYKTTDQYGRVSSVPVSPSYYYVFFIIVANGSTDGWVSMSGKPFASSTSQSFFGYRPSFSYYYTWGTSGLDAAYFEIFDTAPPPVIPPDPCAVPGACASNVLFLPGIEGSKLSDENTGGEVWLPANDDMAEVLRMNNSGSSTSQTITAKGALDTAVNGYHNVYKSLLAEMRDWQSTYGVTATTTPYDWRLDFNTLVTNGRKLPNGHISYTQAPDVGHDPYLIETLKQLATTSKTRKVTIIAHSMGGLVAKEMMLKLGDADTAKYIDKIIFVATPQLGTPNAVYTLLHGYNSGIPLSISDEKTRSLAQDMPSAYYLLPSSPYFTYVDDPVITISSSTLSSWSNQYGNIIHWAQGLYNFMADTAHTRIAPAYSDLANPQIVNQTLLNQAQTTHALLDVWTPPSGVQLYTIAGWGNETVSGIEYTRMPERVCAAYVSGSTCAYYTYVTGPVTSEIRTVIDGDGTVVEPSAMWADGANSTKYWVNLNDYNGWLEHASKTADAIFGTHHDNIFEVPQLRTLLENIIKNGTSVELPDKYISITQPIYLGGISRIHFTLHSPLTLGFTDSSGHYTGSTATTTVFNIPGVDYERFGEVQWLSVPKDLAGQVVMHGTGSGSFALDVEEQQGDTVIATTAFAAIPSSTGTIATLDVNPNQSPTASSTLSVDYNGDGTPDTAYQAKEGEVVLPDITVPTTTVTTTGIHGTNDWYTSNVTLTLSATDTESGVATTTYSFNGGAMWSSTTTSPTTFSIMKEGTTTFEYFSIDKAGNQETTSTLVVKIDKTSPEAQIGFNTSTNKILTMGIDNLSTTTFKTSATSTTITDLASNTLTFKLSQNISQSNYVSLTIPSFFYSTGITTNATTSLRYFWLTDKSNKYTLFISAIRTPTDRLVSLYLPLTNKTYILKSLPTDDTDDLSKMTIQLLLRKIVKQVNGMVVPYITTNSGSMTILY